jgi:hypothetical protein
MSNQSRVNLDPSCGLHVHVENKTRGLDFATTRNLLSTLFTFEAQIEEIHPLYRRNNTAYYPNLRRESNLKNIVHFSQPFLKAALNHILTEPRTILDLHVSVSLAVGKGTGGAYDKVDPPPFGHPPLSATPVGSPLSPTFAL